MDQKYSGGILAMDYGGGEEKREVGGGRRMEGLGVHIFWCLVFLGGEGGECGFGCSSCLRFK